MLGHGRRRKYIVKDDHTGIHFRINNYGSTEIFDTEKPYFSQMSKFSEKGAFIGGTILKCLYL